MKKLSEIDQQKIINDYINGENFKSLSLKYNICTWSIGNVLKKNNIIARIRTHLCNENYFENIDHHNKSYWLGLLFSDGYVRKRRQCNGKHKQGGIVGLGLKEEDKYILDQFALDIESDYIPHLNVKNGKKYYILEINSRKMCDDLINIGCVERKSLVLLPPIIQEKYKPDFIRGYIDGDGSIGFYNNRFKLSILGTKEVLEYIFEYFNENGVKIKPKISKRKNIHVIQFNNQSDIKTIYFLLYSSNSKRFLKRKYEIFNKIITN